MPHIHKAQMIKSTSKEDAVDLICDCGYIEMVGVWSPKLHPHGWSVRQWKTLYPALVACLICWNANLTGCRRNRSRQQRKSGLTETTGELS